MHKPRIIEGDKHKDHRGSLKYNNAFDLSIIKRFYTIEPASITYKRGWQGHKIEQRWFTALKGSFEIKTLAIDNWESPSKDLKQQNFKLSADSLEVLYIPEGHITCIQALEENSILGVFANFALGEVNDEFRYKLNYFNI